VIDTVFADGTHSNVNNSISNGPSLDTGYTISPSIPPFNPDLFEANNKDPNWIRFHQSWTPKSPVKANTQAVFAKRRQPDPDKNLIDDWLRPVNPDTRWTNKMLPFIVDQVSPPPENYYEGSSRSQLGYIRRALQYEDMEMPPFGPWNSPRFYSTVSMSLDVKHRLPQEGVQWLFTRYRTKGMADGRLDVECEVWDSNGRLVALSPQVWVVVDAEALGKKGGYSVKL
jgi:hypothetical protein